MEQREQSPACMNFPESWHPKTAGQTKEITEIWADAYELFGLAEHLEQREPLNDCIHLAESWQVKTIGQIKEII